MTPTPLRPVFLALSFALLPVASAVAATQLYLDIREIPGGSEDPGHVRQIELSSFAWGASVPVTRGLDGRRIVGKPAIQDIAWTQAAADASVVKLFEHSTGGNDVPQATFWIVDPDAATKAASRSLTVRQSVVSSLSLGAGGGSAIVVQGTLNTSALTLEDDGGTPETRFEANYDDATGVASGSLERAPVDRPSGGPTAAGLYLRLGDATTTIAGDTATRGYENWIAIDSFSMGASAASAGFGQPGSKPAISEMSWSQRLDATAPVVLRTLLGGQVFGDATLEQVVIGPNGNPVTVMQQAMNDVSFTSFSLVASLSGDVSMAGSLAFGSYTQTSWVALNDGGRIGPFSVGYDVEAGAPMKGELAAPVLGFGLGNLDGMAAPIPEPQTWALLLAGLAGVVLRARRQAARV